MKYEVPPVVSHASAEALAREDNAEALGDAIIGLSMADPDVAWTSSFLLRFTTHASPNVRGAALIGLGHLSRRFRALPDAPRVAAALAMGLEDPDAWVRGQASDAHDDFAFFIGRE